MHLQCALLSFLPPLVLLLLPTVATSLSFNYSNFHASIATTPGSESCSKDICLQGDASVDQSGVIQLTAYESNTGAYHSKGRAFHPHPMYLWDGATGAVTDFLTNFSFAITNNDNDTIGDGIAFFLSYNHSKLPPTSDQSSMGLVSKLNRLNASGEASFVAVEFDTYMNDWDPSDSHVGINVNSMRSVAYRNLTGVGFAAFNTGHSQVRYDSKTRNLSVSLDYNGTRYSLSQAVDLKRLFPEWVSVGFAASTGGKRELNQILSWSFESTLQDPLNSESNTGRGESGGQGDHVAGRKRNTKAVILIGVGAAVAAASVLCFLIWYVHRKEASTVHEEHEAASMEEEFEKAGGPRRFLFNQLSSATDQFSDDRRLGAGGFGAVFRGSLRDLNREVAIKRTSRNSAQGRKAYMAEVNIISRLRHRNLVQLLGWCHEKGGFLLVYEFMPNGSLDSHLFHADRVLSWPRRYDIAIGVASALLYLHEEWDQCVVHRDIKSSNIMLDEAFNAKLGDFGLARMADHGAGLQTTLLAGTMAYMAPEVFIKGKASKESDVYSFGIVALEIACGRRAIEADEEAEKLRLVEWVWDLYGKGRVLEAADRKLEMELDELEMERLMVVGLWCAYPDLNYRPSIRQAIAALKFEEGTVALPRKMPVPIFGDYDLSYLHSSTNGKLV